ncbi:MAG: type III polyketide synthase [Planctomycetota bacterium]|nr:type III polyketide synthase [Planctomycetaceae bacterium]MDQ3333201.1 type III polyketide synthase [Planctomycetota bacterium]
MPFLIAGLGTALPEHSIDQAEAAAIVEPLNCESDEQRRLLPVLYRRSGVGRRHSVLLEASDGTLEDRQSFFAPRGDGEDFGPTTGERMSRYVIEALPLAERAAASAIERSGIAVSRVTHLVTVSCSGFGAPGWDIGLIDRLHLPRDVARTHVGFMGCHGALNGLRLANAFCEANPHAVVLVAALELCSLHQQYGWEPDRIVSNALFADGAAAVIGTATRAAGVGPPSSSKSSLAPHGEMPSWSVVASGSLVVPNTTDAMSWHIGDHGFEMTLSPKVPDLIQRTLRPWLESWLAANGTSLDRIGSWAVHPGGPRILSATAEALSLSPEALAVSRDVLRDCGNMSSPTVLFLLERLQRQNAPRPCVALGFGPGLTIEAALFA